VSVAVPEATTLSCAELPNVIVEPVGWVVTCGAVHETAFTVMVAVLLSAMPQEFVTRTQYVVVDEGLTVSVALVCPATGLEMSPFGDVYH
jgi:hypothetical protein